MKPRERAGHSPRWDAEPEKIIVIIVIIIIITDDKVHWMCHCNLNEETVDPVKAKYFLIAA
jgi:hypothetical protein